ncbi:MAG: sugar-binding protein [Oceanipulchritudo sp.]
MKPKHALISLILPAAGLFALPDEYLDIFGDPFTPLAIAEAVRTDAPITLDGAADEAVWASAPVYTLGYATWPVPSGLGWDDPVNGVLADPDDLSATFQAAWDDEYLYILVQVTDDVIVIDGSGADYENDDSVEFYLDGDNSREKGTAWNVPGYDFTNDRQLKIKADNSTPMIGGLYDPQEEGTVIVEQDVVIDRTFEETDFGYNIELRMNFSGIFRGFAADGSMVQEPAEDVYFGFDIKVADDDDGAERDITHGWAADSNNSYADPAIFGTMVLTGGGSVEPPVSLWKDVSVIGASDLKETGIGLIVDTNYPWIYSFSLRTFLYVCDPVSESRESAYAYVMGSGQFIWFMDSEGVWYNINTEDWGAF